MRDNLFKIVSENKALPQFELLNLDNKTKNIYYLNYLFVVRHSKYNLSEQYKNFFFNLENVNAELDEYGNIKEIFKDNNAISFTPLHMYDYNKKLKKKIAEIYNDRELLSFDNTFYYKDDQQLEELLKVTIPEIINVIDGFVESH